MRDVAVIVVNYNGRELLDDCISSVVDQIDERDASLDVEVVVVDNASSDDSVDHIRTRWLANIESLPNNRAVTLIELRENRGFAAGNNAGFAAVEARHYLLLNSDARMLPGALSTMVDRAEGDDSSSIGQIGPRLLNPDHTLQRSARGFPSVWNLRTEYWYLRRAFPGSRRFNDFYKGWFDHASETDIDGFLMGACLLVPRSALLKVGAMDESYFMFNEETDWAYRFVQSGYRITFIPTAECIHLGGGSTRKEWDRMYKSQVAGNLRFLAYHQGRHAARRAQKMMSRALLFRSWAYAGLGLLARPVKAERSAALRERARQFGVARQHIRSISTEDFGSPEIPAILG